MMSSRALALLVWLVGAMPAFAAEGGSQGRFLLKGTIRVAPDLARHIDATDRLIIKLHHPRADGLEMDATYQIINDFTLPLDFVAGPAVGMSGSTKHQSYIIEVFTDKDQDVLSVAPNELYGRSAEPIKLGTNNIILELDSLRK